MIERVSLSQGGRVTSAIPPPTPSSPISATMQQRLPTSIPPQQARPHRRHRGRGRQTPAGARSIRSRSPQNSCPTFTSSATPALVAASPNPHPQRMPRPRPAAPAVANLISGVGTVDAKSYWARATTRSRPVTPSRNPASNSRRTGYSSRSRQQYQPRRCAARGPHSAKLTMRSPGTRRSRWMPLASLGIPDPLARGSRRRRSPPCRGGQRVRVASLCCGRRCHSPVADGPAG